MADGAAADGHLLPVPLPTRGPLAALNRRVSELQNTGRFAEALAAADAYEAVAAAVGDELSIRFLWQSRMYVHQNQGHHEEALAAGHELLRRQRAAADIVGEAKALADLAWSLVVTNQTVDAMRYLARSGMLLGRAEPRGERYLSALTSYSTTAWVAELYEIANEGYERVARICPPNGLPDADSPHDIMHVEVLLRWGIRLAQLDERGAARSKLRRAAELTQRWRDGYPHRDGMYYRAMSYRALALAKLDESDEAISLAEAAVLPLRDQQMHEEARLAHVAFGIALSARGDLAAAHRELLAAHQLLTPDAYADDRLIIAHERAALAALTAADDSSQAFLDAIGEQARQLWQLRLQRVAMLRQATEREKLEDEYARTETRLMHDPLTGLGNRVRFDQLMAAADAGQLPHPTTLLLIDIDNFKAINDTYSHSTGDQLLCVIGGILRAHCRSAEDVAVRYAGDEFTVFLHADLPAALEIAHRLGEAVRAADQLPDGVRASISIGAATLQPGMTATELFQCADQHLYRAKRAGRDRVAA